MPGERWHLIIFILSVMGLGFPVRSPAEALPPEVEAIRAEREQQRAALDRIRRKVEALRQAENERIQAEREQVERERTEETERRHRQLQKEAEEISFWVQVRIGTNALLPRLAALYGACFLFLLFAPYRLYIDYWLSHSGAQRHPLLFGSSALCLAGSGWMLSQGNVSSDPEMRLVLGILGLYCWFFLPGFLWFFLVFLHSLVVPHPMEATFKRALRGEKLSREETVNLAEAMYNAKRDGIPADWRIQSHIWRLERLATLLGKEKVFLDLMREVILHPQRGERGK